MEAHLIEAVERVVGRAVIDARVAAGGYTHTARLIVTLAGGDSVFVKAAVDGQTAAWLRAEHRVYAQVEGSFLPKLIAWDDDMPLLVLEDLSAAIWPPPWSPMLIDAVFGALDELRRITPPDGLPVPDQVDDLRGGWRTVASNPRPFLNLGLCSNEWLDLSLPTLVAASARAALDGDSLVHLDVRSDNLCIHDGRCVFVDWSYAARGNPLLDTVLWLPSLHLEGGPAPQHIATPKMTDLAAVFAGYLACRAGLPEPPSVPPPGVRPLQLAQLRIALPWAAHALELPTPTPR